MIIFHDMFQTSPSAGYQMKDRSASLPVACKAPFARTVSCRDAANAKNTIVYVSSVPMSSPLSMKTAIIGLDFHSAEVSLTIIAAVALATEISGRK